MAKVALGLEFHDSGSINKLLPGFVSHKKKAAVDAAFFFV